jgi:hypothetical protein
MNRRNLLGGTAALGAGALLSYVLAPTSERLDNLEGTVASLSTRVAVLEDASVTSSDNSSAPAPTKAAGKSPNSSPSDWLTLSGMGLTATDKFHLDAGTYRVHATIDVQADFSGFILEIYTPAGGDDHVINELTQDGPLEWKLQAIYDAPSSREYYAQISNVDSSWTIAFEPF